MRLQGFVTRRALTGAQDLAVALSFVTDDPLVPVSLSAH